MFNIGLKLQILIFFIILKQYSINYKNVSLFVIFGHVELKLEVQSLDTRDVMRQTQRRKRVAFLASIVK